MVVSCTNLNGFVYFYTCRNYYDSLMFSVFFFNYAKKQIVIEKISCSPRKNHIYVGNASITQTDILWLLNHQNLEFHKANRKGFLGK